MKITSQEQLIEKTPIITFNVAVNTFNHKSHFIQRNMSIEMKIMLIKKIYVSVNKIYILSKNVLTCIYKKINNL